MRIHNSFLGQLHLVLKAPFCLIIKLFMLSGPGQLVCSLGGLGVGRRDMWGGGGATWWHGGGVEGVHAGKHPVTETNIRPAPCHNMSDTPCLLGALFADS